MLRLILALLAVFPARGIAQGTPPTCSITPSIVNGNFGSGSLSPWTTTGTLPNSDTTVVSRSDGSGYAAQMSAAGYNQTGGSATILQEIPICRASIYNIIFDYNLLNVGNTCGLYVKASHNFTTHKHVSTSGRIGNGAGWQTATVNYRDYPNTEVSIMINLRCENFNDTAEAQVSNIQIVPDGSVEPDNCPGRVPDLQNGGFETGQLAPWQFIVLPRGYNIVSPGYESEHALEIPIPATPESITATVEQYFFAEACVGYNYTTTFAVNWGNYSYTSNKPFRDGCRLNIGPQHCTFYSTGTDFVYPEAPNSGWHEISYTCIAGTSVGLRPYFQVRCLRLDKTDYEVIPPFALMLDSVTIGLTPS